MIFKFHFALWCGGLVGVSPFELYEYGHEYLGSTIKDHTLLFTVLPLSLIIFKPLFSILADHYRAHHHCLLLFLLTTLLGYGSLAILPLVPDLLEKQKQLAWTIFCLSTFVGNTSMGIVNSIADSLAVHAADKKNHHYSRYRLWGPIGFGIFGAVWTLADKIPILPKFTPGIFLFVLLHSINIIILAYQYDKEELRIPHWHFTLKRHHEEPYQENKRKLSKNLSVASEFLHSVEARVEMDIKDRFKYLTKMISQERSFYLYMIAFVFCGILTGIQFQFILRFLGELAKVHKFENTGTLVALVIIVQAVGGELVFFLFAEPIIKIIGVVNTLALSFASFGARHLIYAYWLPDANSIYLMLTVELLQGPAFGLMYCVLTHKAHDYSTKVDKIINSEHDPNNENSWRKKNLLHATLQGLLGGSYDGLGLGIGVFVGGKLYDMDRHKMLLLAGVIATILAIVTFLIRSIRYIYSRFTKHKTAPNDRYILT